MCTTKFARKCSVTGQGMNKGYVFNDGNFYCKTIEEAQKYVEGLGLDWEEELATIDTQNEWFYYTEWEEIVEGESWFDHNGNEFTHCYICEKETQLIQQNSFCQHCLTQL